ncbi:response regulator, partial [Myxosarcina sp. GI1]|uniref:hybrid sensor histidine kinase/response regulator n=1 Tax=Myxosarcina sp. GI1 TaxID=1541065 RepID=UPI0020A1947C
MSTVNNVKTILIIDDNVDDRDIYSLYLNRDAINTYEIIETETGNKGLESHQSEKPDLILLDYVLPDMNGLKFIRELKASCERLPPIIMLTGEGNEAVAVKAMKAGVKDYLIKGEINAESFRFAVRNVLEQSRLQQLAERSEHKFRISVENLLDYFGIYSSVRDRNNKIISFRTDYLNQAACKNNLFELQQQTNQNLCQKIASHPKAELFEQCCQVIETGKPLFKEHAFCLRAENKEVFTKIFEIRINKLEDGFVAVWRDITERKLIEQNTRAALEKEKKLNELKTRFVTTTSHEFRTPLASILSSSELLEHYGYKWTEEKKLNHLHRIQASVKHMTGLLNDVLLLGKADAGKLKLNPTKFDLYLLCQELIEEIALIFPTHQIIFSQDGCLSNEKQLAVDNEVAAVDAATSAFVCMDEELLRHILTNLLSNAIKYSPYSDKVYLDVTCETKRTVF